ncbi:MAG: DUF177 domain-containing protein [Chlorobiaceae bacterium]|nr:DUF177 domain-containing protein [Chlorobiaceae bacterium]
MPKERALIAIRLAGLSQGIHEFDFTCDAVDFNDSAVKEAGFSDGISVRAVVDKNDEQIAVSLETTAKAGLSCDLCLAPVPLELKGTYRTYYIYEQVQGQGEDDEEYRLIDRNTVSIDLTEDVRETLLLSVPMKVTCTDNPGCQVYRQERPEDADSAPEGSWQESLEKLKNKYR